MRKKRALEKSGALFCFEMIFVGDVICVFFHEPEPLPPEPVRLWRKGGPRGFGVAVLNKKTTYCCRWFVREILLILFIFMSFS